MARMPVAPSSWRSRLRDRFAIGRAESASDAGYDSEEGEELGRVEDDDARAGLASMDARRFGVDDARRLSRELSVPRPTFSHSTPVVGRTTTQLGCSGAG